MISGFKKVNVLLLLVFFIALIVRFLYFPKDISFGYDQARDAYTSLKVMSGDLKIIGPSTTLPNVYHGAAFYYIFGPVYKLSGGDTQGLSVFMRIYNSIGIFLVFAISFNLFKNKIVAILAATLFAFSFEQSQYSIFLGHPALGVISVLVFYLGLSSFIFKKNKFGLPLALFGLGMSMQFHFTLINLFLVLIANLILFKKKFFKINFRMFLLSTFSLIFATSTFLLAELKYGFRTLKTLINFFGKTGLGNENPIKLENSMIILRRFIHDNVISLDLIGAFLILLMAVLFFMLIRMKNTERQGKFLLTWLVVGIVPYLSGKNIYTNYYFAIGASVSILILVSYFISLAFSKSKTIGLLLLSIIVMSNLYLITKINPRGTIEEVNAQVGMRLSDEMDLIDYAYQKAEGKPFSINALTIPYQINTTWSYLFEWYGFNKYGYLPIWGGEAASGYEGNLEVITAQSNLPLKRISFIEPGRGKEGWMQEEFPKVENLFWDVREEKYIGEFKVQYREKKI